MMSVEKDILNRLNYALRASGLSKKNVTDVVNVSKSTILRWFSGLSMPNVQQLIVLSDILDVSPEWLLSGNIDHEHEHVDYRSILCLLLNVRGSVSDKELLKLVGANVSDAKMSRFLEIQKGGQL